MTDHPDYADEARRILKGIPEAITEHYRNDTPENMIIDSVTMNVRIATAFALLDVAAAIREHTNRATDTEQCHEQLHARGSFRPCTLEAGHYGWHTSAEGDSW
jgi:hypothetical protein